jgi:hypothetical protein
VFTNEFNPKYSPIVYPEHEYLLQYCLYPSPTKILMVCSKVDKDPKDPEDLEELRHLTFKESTGTREAKDTPYDQGIKICSIFKVLGLRRKQCHCVRLVFLIPAVYLFSRMESVWRRYRDLTAKSNRSKLDADCTCPYSPYGHVEGRTFC